MSDNFNLDNMLAKVVIGVISLLLIVALFTQIMSTPAADANVSTPNGTVPTRTPQPWQYIPVVRNEK